VRPLSFAACCTLAACAALAAPVPKPRDTVFYKPGWDRPVDPDKDCKFRVASRDRLTIEVPAKDHDIDGNRKRDNAPRLLRTFEGDFRMEVRVSGDFHATPLATADGAGSYSAGGLVVMLGDKNETSLRLELGRARYEGEALAYVALKSFSAKATGSVTALATETGEGWPLKRGATEAYLRLERRGGMFHPSFSPDGKTWTRHTNLGIGKPPEKLKVGVIALSTSKGALKVTFEQFKLTSLGAGGQR
jgi:regulation of enolase protein 1 (concanavalin A-like superfamily)